MGNLKKLLSKILVIMFLVTTVFPYGGLSIALGATNASKPPQDPEQYASWKKSLYNAANVNSGVATLTSSIGSISNDFIEYVVANGGDGSGRFTIGTTGGNPDNTNDDNQKMLYGHPNPGTSFTAIKVDGTDNYFTAQSVTPDSANLSTKAIEEINGINVEQELSIVTNSNTGKADTVQIKYIAKNQDSVVHTVGTRIMMDTMLGSNDAAPFRIPGYGDVTTELELTGDRVPDYWMAFDSLTNPSVIGQGTLLRTDNKPDKVQFTNWYRASETMWDLTVSPGSPNGDSAVSVFWNPTQLQPGESKTYVTYYGLSDFIQNLTPPIGVTLNRVSSIDATTNGYNPNPIKISGFVNNLSSVAAQNVKVKINLNNGLSVVNGTNEITIGSLGINETKDFYWDVMLPNFSADTTLTYSVEASADNTENKVLTNTFTVPASKVVVEPPTISGLTDALTIPLGESKSQTGTITSSGKNIEKVSLCVEGWYDDADKVGLYKSEIPNSTSFDLSKFTINTADIPFNKEGTYAVNIWAKLEGIEAQKVGSFTVVVGSGIPPTITGFTGPVEMTSGEKKAVLPGAITSNTPLTAVTIGVAGKQDILSTKSFATADNITSFNMSEFVIDTTTGVLATPGTYEITLWAKSVGCPDPQSELGRITLVVKDGVVTNTPTVSISSPANNTEFVIGNTVEISGIGTGCDHMGLFVDGSFVEGSVQTGNTYLYDYKFTTAGTHEIKLVGRNTPGETDPGTKTAEASVTVNVTQAVVVTPTFSLPTGTYTSAQNVTINCDTNGATIKYTIDGSEPTSTSIQYSGPISIQSTTTIKAKAFMVEMTDSATASATYTIDVNYPQIISADIISPLPQNNLVKITQGNVIKFQVVTNLSVSKLFLQTESIQPYIEEVQKASKTTKGNNIVWTFKRPIYGVGTRNLKFYGESSNGQKSSVASMGQTLAVDIDSSKWSINYNQTDGQINIRQTGGVEWNESNSYKLYLKDLSTNTELFPGYDNLTQLISGEEGMPELYNSSWGQFADLGLIEGRSYEIGISGTAYPNAVQQTKISQTITIPVTPANVYSINADKDTVSTNEALYFEVVVSSNVTKLDFYADGVKCDTFDKNTSGVSITSINSSQSKWRILRPLQSAGVRKIQFKPSVNTTEYPLSAQFVTITVKQSINNLFYYSQRDRRWASDDFDCLSTLKYNCVGDSACGPVSLSMVVANLKNDDTLYTPSARISQLSPVAFALEKYRRYHDQGPDQKYFTDAADRYSIKLISQNTNGSAIGFNGITDLANYLSDSGNMAIASMTAGHFTTEGHYIVLCGYKVIDGVSWIKVMDPNSWNIGRSETWGNKKYNSDFDFSETQSELSEGKAICWIKASVIGNECKAYWVYSSGSTPLAPTGLSAVPESTNQINLVWDASIGATNYEVLRADSSGRYEKINSSTITGTSYSDTGLQPGTTYNYKVQAVNSAGTGAQSGIASTSTLLSKPHIISPLINSLILPLDFTITWSSVSGATKYKLYVRDLTTNEQFVNVETVETSYKVFAYYPNKIVSGHSYRVALEAISSSGVEAWADNNELEPITIGSIDNNLIINASVTQTEGYMENAFEFVINASAEITSLKLLSEQMQLVDTFSLTDTRVKITNNLDGTKKWVVNRQIHSPGDSMNNDIRILNWVGNSNNKTISKVSSVSLKIHYEPIIYDVVTVTPQTGDAGKTDFVFKMKLDWWTDSIRLIAEDVGFSEDVNLSDPSIKIIEEDGNNNTRTIEYHRILEKDGSRIISFKALRSNLTEPMESSSKSVSVNINPVDLGKVKNLSVNWNAVLEAMNGVPGDSNIVTAQAALVVMGFPLGYSGPHHNGVDGVPGRTTKFWLTEFKFVNYLDITAAIKWNTQAMLDQDTMDTLRNAVDEGKTMSSMGINISNYTNPSRKDAINYITDYANKIGLPVRLALATAWTESGMNQFNENMASGPNESNDWGLMQVNSEYHTSEFLGAYDNTPETGDLVRDWRFNIDVGLGILKKSYDIAKNNNPNADDETIARSAYSAYNAGSSQYWRYKWTKIEALANGKHVACYNNDGYDTRDIAFKGYYENQTWLKP